MELVSDPSSFLGTRELGYSRAFIRIVGILTILLQSPSHIIKPFFQLLTSSITSLTLIAKQYDGHLPPSLPAPRQAEPPVQICHGSPGLILLLATFRAMYPGEWKAFPQEWRAEWDEVEDLASQRVWEEGLVTKGLGVCHGVSGNAWPWVLLDKANRRSVPPTMVSTLT